MTLKEGLHELRLLPLNQVAELKLKSAGESPRPELLPILQLMHWGVENGIRVTHQRTLEELQRLQQQEPNVAYAYLTTRLPGGVTALERRLLRMSPRAAAEVLLDILDLRLKADPRNRYPE